MGMNNKPWKLLFIQVELQKEIATSVINPNNQ